MVRDKSTIVFLDTDIILWLAEGKIDKLSENTKQFLENTPYLAISSMSLLEIHFLFNMKKILRDSDEIVNYLRKFIDIEIKEGTMSLLVEHAKNIDWTDDIFDQMIVAHAASCNATLVTANDTIREHYEKSLI